MMDPMMLQKLQQMIYGQQGMPGQPVQRPPEAPPQGLPPMPMGGMPQGAAPGGVPGGGPNPQMLMALMQKLGMAGRKM